MKYIVTKFAGCVFDGEIKYLKPNIKYEIGDVKNCVYYGSNGEIPFSFNLRDKLCTRLQIVDIKGSQYYFIFPCGANSNFSTIIRFKSKDVLVSLSESLIVSIKGEIILEKQVVNLRYSYYEIRENFLIVYFIGVRNFIVVINNEEVKYADYYDECNIDGESLLFMTRLNDSINHGRVLEIGSNKVDSYLVYLDDFELNIKEEFISYVFMDCLIAGNYKYCNELLVEEIKCDEYEKIIEFFPQFDHFFVDNNIAILFQKNTLVGVFEFEVLNHKISNIKCQ